ncbi:DMT family transporter [Pseudonocardia acaciae]|uniref:DMT family transporter n=1 Tax=Pseudonocardia acaciae TaxID=551276 RepID=UPI000490E505|nr:DMT family transporter [Pseudonocardia acaciae]
MSLFRNDLMRVVAAGMLWGTGGLAGAVLGRLTELQPLAVATYRLAGGGLTVLAVMALTSGVAPLTRAGLGRVLAVGGLTASYQACYFAAVSLTSVGVATLVTLGAAPVLVLAVEAARARRRPGLVPSAAIGLAVLGLALLLGVPGGFDGGALALGASLALVSAAGFAALTLLGRRPVPGLDGPATIGFGFTAGAVMLGVITVPGVGVGFAPTAASVGVLLFFAWVPTAVAYGLFFTGLRGVSATSAAVVAVLEPVTATVLGVLLLGERLGAAGAVGAGLLCAAAVVAALRAG